jgi:hypothetical protein
MKFRYRQGNVDIEHDGKIARFWGDLCNVGFAAIASTMEWLSPNSSEPVSETERNEFMKAVNEHFANVKDRVFFVDDNGKELPDENEKVAVEERNSLVKKVKKFCGWGKNSSRE